MDRGGIDFGVFLGVFKTSVAGLRLFGVVQFFVTVRVFVFFLLFFAFGVIGSMDILLGFGPRGDVISSFLAQLDELRVLHPL